MSDPELFPAPPVLDARIGRIRVRCYGAVVEDGVVDDMDVVGMRPGDLLLQVKGMAMFLIVPAADRLKLAATIAPPDLAAEEMRCEAHGVVLCPAPGCSPGPGGGA